MSNLNIPAGYQQVMPYLILNDTLGFFSFMQTVFGATEKMIMRGEDNTIRHGEVQVGDSTIMFGQASAEWPQNTGAFFIYVEDADATYRKALETGCTSIMEPSDREYGRTCGINDPYGNVWWPTSAPAS
jgi:PhnB protein